LETNALLRIESIKILDGKQEVPFEMAGHNGEAVLGNVIYFKNTDPGIVVVPFLENGEGIIEITVQFSVLQFDLDDRSQNVLDVLFCEFNGVNVQKVDAAELTEAKGYITHLEEDIAEQKHYIGHLEQDIRAIKAHIAQSEETIVEQKAYITHLEKDIAEQKGYIVHREKDIAEQKAYIEHLEKDIAELKNNQS
jgi:uncharacterized coiled-coil protein SlyX